MVKKSTKTANKVTDKLPNEVPTIWKFKKQIKKSGKSNEKPEII